jgi:hypothetical protein
MHCHLFFENIHEFSTIRNGNYQYFPLFKVTFYASLRKCKLKNTNFDRSIEEFAAQFLYQNYHKSKKFSAARLKTDRCAARSAAPPP